MILFSDNNTPPPAPTPGRAFLCPPGRPAWAAMSLYSPASSRRLCAVLRPAGGYFVPASSRAEHTPKTANRRKGHLQARRAVFVPGSIPTLPCTKSPYKGPQIAIQRINQPRPAPLWSKPGYFHSFRAMDSTAQRSFSASHQAQRDPLHKGGLRAIRGGHPFAISISARISA